KTPNTNRGSAAVEAVSATGGPGVHGESKDSDGVQGQAGAPGRSGVYGFSTNANGFGGFFQNTAGGIALGTDGTAQVGVLQITGGSDLAEPFEVSGAEAITPGMVVASDPAQPGRLRLADRAYDRTVAGIVSGANGINPGLTMKQSGTIADGLLPVALTGRVYCWANASYGAIEPGDLLTTSDTPGHAMKITNRAKAQGA